MRRIAREYILNNFRNDVYKTTDGKGVVFTRKGAKKITNTEYLSKIRISTELDNFIKTAEYVKTVPNAKSVNPEFGYFDYYRANFMLDGKMFNCLINVGVNTQTGAGVFYEITQIKEAPHNSFGENQSAAPASNGTSTDIIPNNEQNVNPDGKKRYALRETDSESRTLTEEQRKFFQNSKFTDRYGHLLTLYHQTASEFTIFDTSIKGTGQHDYLTPFGIFMKPSSKNIGIKGNIQMALYGNVVNPIEFADRAALETYLREAGFGKDIDGIINLDAEYQAKSEAAEKRYMDLAIKAYKNPENKILQSQLETAEQEWSGVIDEWGKAFDKRSANLKELVNKHFKSTQYDGIILRKDGGSFGRETMAYIAFEPNQVKSVSNTSPTGSADIRFALSGAEFQERVTAAQNMRDEARSYKKRLKINSDGSVTIYHGTSAKNAESIRSKGIINEQSYFTTNVGEAYYYAHQKNKNGVVLEIHADARALEFAAAGAELYAPSQLIKIDGVYTSSDIRYALAPMTEEQYRFVSKLSMIEATQTSDNSYSVYCENKSGLLEYCQPRKRFCIVCVSSDCGRTKG